MTLRAEGRGGVVPPRLEGWGGVVPPVSQDQSTTVIFSDIVLWSWCGLQISGPQNVQIVWLCCGLQISGPQNDQIVWLCCGLQISGPQHDQIVWSCCGPGRALVLLQRVKWWENERLYRARHVTCLGTEIAPCSLCTIVLLVVSCIVTSNSVEKRKVSFASLVSR